MPEAAQYLNGAMMQTLMRVSMFTLAAALTATGLGTGCATIPPVEDGVVGAGDDPPDEAPDAPPTTSTVPLLVVAPNRNP